MTESADAKLKDGILTLVLKKKPITDAIPIMVKRPRAVYGTGDAGKRRSRVSSLSI
jgi:hypothetical protein